MKLMYTLLFISIIFNGNTQQLPIYSQFFNNDYVINPAFTGEGKYSPILIGFRNQWTGFKGAPSTYTIGGHSFIENKNMGLGGMIFIDDMGGAISQTGIMLNYSYKIKLNEKSKLSLGITGILNQYKYDASKIVAKSTNDLSLYSNTKATVPDFNFGIAYIFDEKLKVGISAHQLFQFKLKNWNNQNMNIDTQNKLVRHYNFTLSYAADLNENLQIEPFTLIRTTFINPIQFEIGTKLTLKQHFYTILNYRHLDAIMIGVGTTYNNFCFGYSYDITTSKLRNYSKGTHEITLGYRFEKGIKKKSSKI